MKELFTEYPKAVSDELTEIKRRHESRKKRTNKVYLCRRLKLISYLLTKKGTN